MPAVRTVAVVCMVLAASVTSAQRPASRDEQQVPGQRGRRRLGREMTMGQKLALAVIAAICAASPLRAHHDWPVDRSRLIALQGTVTAFTWANPHVRIALEVESDGAIEKWVLGASSPKVLLDNGWDKTALTPGTSCAQPAIASGMAPTWPSCRRW